MRHHSQKIRLAVVDPLGFRARDLGLVARLLGVGSRLLLEQQKIDALLVGVAKDARRPEHESDKRHNARDCEQRHTELGFVETRWLSQYPDDAEQDRREQSGGQKSPR